MKLLNPLLASRIDWVWFMASQVAFGVVAGAVVVRRSPMPTLENVSFALRAGIAALPDIGARHVTAIAFNPGLTGGTGLSRSLPAAARWQRCALCLNSPAGSAPIST